ncbi:MAG: transcription elongation factor GreA [Firmicutes bacterium]|nr:transcription elongation factor GreA [Bacillota bacterium]
MDKTIPLTQGKFSELTEKLRHNETVKRGEISDAIKTAKEFGDLSENAEYSAAKSAQEKLEIEIAQLSDILMRAYPIDKSTLGTTSVQVGNFVAIYDSYFDEEVTYQIVSSIEASTAENKISNQSLIGKALVGKKKGDLVTVTLPTGVDAELKVLSISK